MSASPTMARTGPAGGLLSSELPVVACPGMDLAAARLPLVQEVVEVPAVAVRALLRQEARLEQLEVLAPPVVLAAVSLQGPMLLAQLKAMPLSRRLAGPLRRCF